VLTGRARRAAPMRSRPWPCACPMLGEPTPADALRSDREVARTDIRGRPRGCIPVSGTGDLSARVGDCVRARERPLRCEDHHTA
jgi:hypothetical protein